MDALLEYCEEIEDEEERVSNNDQVFFYYIAEKQFKLLVFDHEIILSVISDDTIENTNR